MQNATPPPAVPIEPSGAILAAFDDHQVVAPTKSTTEARLTRATNSPVDYRYSFCLTGG